MTSDLSDIAGIVDLYAPFREKITALGTDDAFYAIWAYAQHLQLPDFQFPRDIEVARSFIEHNVPRSLIGEWELLLLAKEVVIHGATTGLSLRSWATLSSVVNAIKELENAIYRRYGSSKNIHVEVNRIAHRQFSWQGDHPNNASFARYLVIFDTPEIDQIARERTGVAVRSIFQYGLMLYGGFLEAAVVGIPSAWEGIDQEIFNAFLTFAAREEAELAKILLSEQALNSTFVYAYNSLFAYPLITTKRGSADLLLCPLPTLLFWRMTKGLYYELIGDPRFGAQFGISFQNYVGEAITRALPRKRFALLAERKYGSKALLRDSVDWIVSDEECALFIECKAKRLSWTAKQSLDDIRPLLSDISYLAAAVVQTYKNYVDYRDNKYPHLPHKTERDILLLVVTLENWYIFGPKMREWLHTSINEKMDEAGLPKELLDQVPHSIIPIAELESGMQVSDEVGLFEFWWGKITHPEMSEWNWLTYILDQYPNFDFVNLFEKELDALAADGGSS